MNIVCYSNQLSGGGAERVMSVLASGLAQRGHCVTMIIGNESPREYPLDSRIDRIILDKGNMPTSRKGGVKRTWKRIKMLRDICKRKEADILVSFLSDANFRAILSTRFLKTKNLISVRNDPKVAYGKRHTAILAKLLYPMTDGCVFQTKEAKSWFSDRIQRKSRIIFNPVSDVFYNVEPITDRQKRIVKNGLIC